MRMLLPIVSFCLIISTTTQDDPCASVSSYVKSTCPKGESCFASFEFKDNCQLADMEAPACVPSDIQFPTYGTYGIVCGCSITIDNSDHVECLANTTAEQLQLAYVAAFSEKKRQRLTNSATSTPSNVVSTSANLGTQSSASRISAASQAIDSEIHHLLTTSSDEATSSTSSSLTDSSSNVTLEKKLHEEPSQDSSAEPSLPPSVINKDELDDSSPELALKAQSELKKGETGLKKQKTGDEKEANEERAGFWVKHKTAIIVPLIVILIISTIAGGAFGAVRYMRQRRARRIAERERAELIAQAHRSLASYSNSKPSRKRHFASVSGDKDSDFYTEEASAQ